MTKSKLIKDMTVEEANQAHADALATALWTPLTKYPLLGRDETEQVAQDSQDVLVQLDSHQVHRQLARKR